MDEVINHLAFKRLIAYTINKYKFDIHTVFGSFDDFAHEVAIHIFKYGKSVNKSGEKLKYYTIIVAHCKWVFWKAVTRKTNERKHEHFVDDKVVHEFPELDDPIELINNCETLTKLERKVLKKMIELRSFSFAEVANAMGSKRGSPHRAYYSAIKKLKEKYNGYRGTD